EQIAVAVDLSVDQFRQLPDGDAHGGRPFFPEGTFPAQRTRRAILTGTRRSGNASLAASGGRLRRPAQGRRLVGAGARGNRGEAQALDGAAYARQAVEDGADAAVHQVVVQGQGGRAGVDAHHVTPDPVAVQVDVAEAVAAAQGQSQIVL